MKFLLLLFIPWMGFSECAREMFLSGDTISKLEKKDNIFVGVQDRYIPIKYVKRLNSHIKYPVQFLDRERNFLNYNDEFLNYYGLSRFNFFIKKISALVEKSGYHIQKIGESVKARDLLVIKPKILDPEKKTLLMLVRHHGNEGTANWIFEGFIETYLKDLKKTQIIIYPMINPDGVVKKTRYNANGRDLNRTWNKNLDEVGKVFRHLKSLIPFEKIDFLLDMHSHKSSDIIYRVDENYISPDYFNHQSNFIETLGSYDSWQNGNYITSNGKEGMSRIYFARTYGINSLTHETLKNIPRESNRSILTLKEQGRALNQALKDYLDTMP